MRSLTPRGIREAARREGISINQFIASASGEKLAAWAMEGYLAARGRRGDRAQFEAALARVGADEPAPGDEV
ncbi:MAG: toxin-antitoxin system HicB family antitoxin [Myxococcales bacterium]|nr:toxin-antitoxin system HicB family antitoxin [Myxococcales bacterium]